MKNFLKSTGFIESLVVLAIVLLIFALVFPAIRISNLEKKLEYAGTIVDVDGIPSSFMQRPRTKITTSEGDFFFIDGLISVKKGEKIYRVYHLNDDGEKVYNYCSSYSGLIKIESYDGVFSLSR